MKSSILEETPLKMAILDIGGEGGIRTLDTLSSTHAFQACAFNHSATSPAGSENILSNLSAAQSRFIFKRNPEAISHA